MKPALISTVIACIICTASVEYFGAMLGDYKNTYINNGINGAENLELDDEENQYYRTDISENYDNYPMFWGLSSMRAFQSIVPGSIMEFYTELGITRDVASRVPLDNYALRGLYSVKYYFDKVYEDKRDEYKYKIDLPGFEYKNEQNGFYVYENKYYIPMGFTYDYYVSSDIADQYSNQTKERILTRAVILNEEQIEKYSDIISELPAEDSVGLNKETYIEDCKKRAASSCPEFTYDSDGFNTKINLESSKLVFFSVPYESGWTAYVNGKPADVEKVSFGFMAVKAEKGENEISFRYSTPGLKIGTVMTLSGMALLIIYLFIMRKSKDKNCFVHYYDYDTKPVDLQKQYVQRRIYGKYKKEEK